MAYDFLGTFNQSQLERFRAFAQNQQADCIGRIKHLAAELIRIGKLSFAYSGGNPVGYVASPKESYIGRLIACYEILGGNALYDLNIRSVTQPVTLIRGDEGTPAQLLSTGEVMGQPGLADGPSALLMQQARSWLPEVLHYKREYLERKIRRMIDYSDQLQQEITLLTTILSNQETEGSMAYIMAQIDELLSDPMYRAIGKDNGKDPFGKQTYAPFGGYTSGPETAPADDWVRGPGGVPTAPGEGTA